MTRYSISGAGDWPEELACSQDDEDDAEIDSARLRKEFNAFPGAQHFNEIMLEKMRPKKVAKFRVSRRQESDF